MTFTRPWTEDCQQVNAMQVIDLHDARSCMGDTQINGLEASASAPREAVVSVNMRWEEIPCVGDLHQNAIKLDRFGTNTSFSNLSILCTQACMRKVSPSHRHSSAQHNADLIAERLGRSRK